MRTRLLLMVLSTALATFGCTTGGGGASTPTCLVPKVSCSGACADLMTDAANCGGCGMACPMGRACAGGACAVSCPMGQTECKGACVNTMTDAANCGGCGMACPMGSACTGAACAVSCPVGQSE